MTATSPRPIAFKPALALGVLSGFLYFLAFPGIDLWPLGFVALVPLIVALRGQTPRHALFIGWAAGLTMTLFGFYWLLEMLKTFSGFPTAVCALFLVLLCGYQGGRIGLLGWLSARAEVRRVPFGVAFTLGFVASELVYPLLFPWYYAAVVHQLPAMLQPAELGGPIAVGLVLVAANLALAELVLARRDHRRPRPRILVGLSAVVAVALLYGAVRIPQVDAAAAAAPRGKVGLVQANMSLFGKRQQMQEGLRRHVQLTREIARAGDVDLVVWSETSVMGAIWEEEVAAVVPQRVSRRLGVPTVFGAVLARPVDDVRRNVVFNTALAVDAKGQVTARYDKHYRLPFGEFLPLGDTFPVLYEWSPNSGRFAKGDSVEPLRLGDHEIATFICYEDVIPGFVRSIVRAGDPDLLVNLTNDAWFGDTTEPWIHLALSKLRAIEHRRFFVRSTNSGVSAVVDPVGRVLGHTETFREATLTIPISWLRGSTLYGFWGDGPWWLVTIAAFVLAFLKPGWRGLGAAGGIPPSPDGSTLTADAAVLRFRMQSRRWLVENGASRGANE